MHLDDRPIACHKNEIYVVHGQPLIHKSYTSKNEIPQFMLLNITHVSRSIRVVNKLPKPHTDVYRMRTTTNVDLSKGIDSPWYTDAAISLVNELLKHNKFVDLTTRRVSLPVVVNIFRIIKNRTIRPSIHSYPAGNMQATTTFRFAFRSQEALILLVNFPTKCNIY